MMPAAVLTISAGIWLTRSSPTVRIVYCESAASASPLHHADEDPAQDVDPGDEQPGDGVAADELGGAVHRAIEVGLAGDLLAPTPRLPSSISPAFRSASMLICRPGMASRVKRAATSATRPAPFVITTKLIATRIRKMTTPTT